MFAGGSDASARVVTFHVELLGGFATTRQGRRLELGPAGERLVALLASRNREVSRHIVAGLLWPECPEGRALANLRSTLHRVTPRAQGLLVSARTRLRLDLAVEVDLRSATVAGRRILAGRPDEADLSASTRDLLSNDVLPDWYEEDWIVMEREAFRQVRLHALEAACLMLADLGRYGEAVAAGLAATSAEPLRESAHRALITAHLREANHAEAMAQYERCRTVLRDELGVDPSPCLLDLVRAQAGTACAERRHHRRGPRRPGGGPAQAAPRDVAAT